MRPRATLTALLLATMAHTVPATMSARAQQPAAAPPAAEDIGSWTLACSLDRMTDKASCTLRLREWVDRPGESSPGLALEIIDRGGRLVPAVTARELTVEGAGRGLLALSGEAQLRMGSNPFFEMPCGLDGRSLLCTPRRVDAERAERELPTATRVLVRMVGVGAGGKGAEPTELAFSGTAQAMARFRQFVPPGTAQDDPPGLSGREMLDRLQRLLGR